MSDVTEEKRVICKRCGFDQSVDYSPVSEAELQEYFKASLGQVGFQKSYKLFGGRLQCTFEEPTGKLLRLQEMLMLHRVDEHKGSIADAADFALLSALKEVIQTPEEGDAKVVYSADQEARERILTNGKLPPEIENMPVIRLQALRSAYTQFATLCTKLAAAANDENFWMGVGRN